MQTRSELYRRLLADPEHVRETKVSIAGVEYGQERIYTCTTSGGLFSDAGAGGCLAREIDLAIEPAGDIPRMAPIAVYARLVLGAEASEWVPRGVFYIDTRSADEGTGLLTLHGFDALLKAEAVWLDPSQEAGEWPMTPAEAVADIAKRMGVRVDPRTRIEAGFQVDYPNDLTMREVLSYLAACHGGNWIITGDGALLLVPLGGLPAESSFLVDGMDGGAILFGEVRVLV